MLRHVIWDLGGTLVNTYPQLNATFVDVVAAHGHEVTLEEVAALTHVSRGHAIATLTERFGVEAEAFERAGTDLKRRWETVPPPATDGARELMRDISARGGLNLVATHRDRRSATSLLRELGLRIDDIACAPDGFARKPAPDMHRELVTRHELDPSECLGVGDRLIDLEAAHAAGLAAAFLLVTGEDPLNEAKDAEYKVTHLSELRPVLGLPG